MALQSIYYAEKNGATVELKVLTLKKDPTGYYLAAKFQVEDDHSVRELDIPHISLNVNCDEVSIHAINYYLNDDRATINLGFGKLPLDYGMSNGYRALYTEKILEEKCTEMTMDEIEKKLGYKVKIVNKKKE